MFSERLKEARRRTEYTQQDMADKLGIGRATYANYEVGKREPDLNTIRRIVKLLGVTSDFLLGLVDSPELKKVTSPDGDVTAVVHEDITQAEMDLGFSPEIQAQIWDIVEQVLASRAQGKGGSTDNTR